MDPVAVAEESNAGPGTGAGGGGGGGISECRCWRVRSEEGEKGGGTRHAVAGEVATGAAYSHRKENRAQRLVP